MTRERESFVESLVGLSINATELQGFYLSIATCQFRFTQSSFAVMKLTQTDRMKSNFLEPTSELAALEKTANNAQNRDTFF